MPPLLCFNWGDDDGFETKSRAVHYGKRAYGGTGLIVIEATAVCKGGRIKDTQLGLWKDEHIPQFEQIANACKKQGSLVVVQIVHAGMNSLGTRVFSSSQVNLPNKECLGMTLEDIEKVKKSFLLSAIRAKKSGLQGVEVHGAHGYLLNQFTSKEINKRTDNYGGSLENRLKLPLEIIKDIRATLGNDFIISYRFGVNDPSLEEDKIFAKKLEEAGVDLLNVSGGIGYDSISIPKDFPFDKITYLGTALNKEVNIPVACVYGINEPYKAEYLLANNLIDMVAVGRGLLADPNWTNKAILNEPVNICFNCQPKCKYTINGVLCPLYTE